jgi:hypothetical protein
VEGLEVVFSVCLGIGLSAACGFRVFVPLLGMSIAALSGHLTLSEGFQWIGTWPAFVCFLSATGLEIAGYYVPWIDNLLDSLATPSAVVAGTIVTASVVTDMSPMMRWSLAVIAGGGVAAVVQTSTVALRGTSSLTTGGLANFVVSSGELVASSALTIGAFVLPILVAICVMLMCVAAIVFLVKQRGRLAAGRVAVPQESLR